MIIFKLFDYDENFNVVNGKLPLVIESHFGDQMDRAREILKGRDLAELHYGLDSLDWMLQKGSELQNEHSFKITNEKEYCVISRVKALKLFADDVDITDQTQFPNATWADYFALLTLAYVREVLHPGNSKGADLEKFIFTGSYPFDIDFPIECMEAICIAECYKKIDSIEPQNNELMRKRGQKGGQMKAEIFGEIQRKCVQFYIEKFKTRSNRDASRRIIKELTDKDLKIFTTDDPAHTIERWIAKYKNGEIKLS